MIFIIDWETFHSRFYVNATTIYVNETEETWDFYTEDGIHTIKCSVTKPLRPEEQALWKSRWVGSQQTNIISVMDVQDDQPIPEKEQSDLIQDAGYVDPLAIPEDAAGEPVEDEP